MPHPQKLIIDTDPGDDVDDVIALAFALRRPELDIRAITTVTNFPVERVFIVRKLLRILGCPEIPVAAGNARPLDTAVVDEPPFQYNGGYILNQNPFVTPEERAAELPVDQDAVGLMIRTVEAHPGEVAIATIGPATNLGATLRQKPEIARKIAWVAMMGGEVKLERTEHNIAWDPIAADIVLTSGVPIFLGTWDITRRVVLLPEHCERIRAQGTPLSDALAQCIDLWWPHKASKPGPVMYDLAPILWSMDQGARASDHHYVTQPLGIQVQTDGAMRGRTTLLTTSAPNAQVTIDMTAEQAEAACNLLMETLLG